MARPLRIEYSGALYHVTSRGNHRQEIFVDPEDRERFLGILAHAVRRHNWLCHAYCQMDNHYHLVIETPDGNLSKGMRQVGAVYTQAYNRRHGKSGHLFQGRYKAILVENEEYAEELSRDIHLNPTRVGAVQRPQDYAWSSYMACVGQASSPRWLTKDLILLQFGCDEESAQERDREFVEAGLAREQSAG